jgi:glucuronoarabinoxylan endo-1,4-beta-xylanase
MMALRFVNWLFLLSFVSATCAYDVTVNWNDVHQKITGFGGGTGCPDCGGGNASHYGNSGLAIFNLPEPARTRLLDLMFDSTKGIGLNCFRFGMSWLLEDQSTGAWHFNQNVYDSSEIWVAREALKRNSKMMIWSAPWTPPLWMKTQQSMGGGELQSQYYQRYADYTAHFVRDMRDKAGIPLMAVSVQNEPQFGSAGYGGCSWTGAQIRDFVKNNLGPTLKRDSLDKTTTIMIAESNYGESQYVDPTVNDPAALAYVGILGWHQYNDGGFARPAGKESWSTEQSHGGWSGFGDVGWTEGLWQNGALYDAIVNKDANCWVYYIFSGWGNGSLFASNGTTIDSTAKKIWWLGHYSKFVRPGWVRIGTSVKTVGDGAKLAAFKDPKSGKFAIVVANTGISAPGNSITVTCEGFTPKKVSAWLTPGDQNPHMVGPTDVPIVNGKFTYLTPNVSIATLVGETGAVGTERAIAAQPPVRMTAARVPSGLRVIMDRPAAGLAELLDSRGRMVARWRVDAVREQTLRLSQPLAGGVHFIRVMSDGGEALMRTTMLN